MDVALHYERTCHMDFKDKKEEEKTVPYHHQ